MLSGRLQTKFPCTSARRARAEREESAATQFTVDRAADILWTLSCAGTSFGSRAAAVLSYSP